MSVEQKNRELFELVNDLNIQLEDKRGFNDLLSELEVSFFDPDLSVNNSIYDSILDIEGDTDVFRDDNVKKHRLKLPKSFHDFLSIYQQVYVKYQQAQTGIKTGWKKAIPVLVVETMTYGICEMYRDLLRMSHFLINLEKTKTEDAIEKG